eukprot:3945587-Amphidinium_carterae.1
MPPRIQSRYYPACSPAPRLSAPRNSRHPCQPPACALPRSSKSSTLCMEANTRAACNYFPTAHETQKISSSWELGKSSYNPLKRNCDCAIIPTQMSDLCLTKGTSLGACFRRCPLDKPCFVINESKSDNVLAIP